MTNETQRKEKIAKRSHARQESARAFFLHSSFSAVRVVALVVALILALLLLLCLLCGFLGGLLAVWCLV